MDQSTDPNNPNSGGSSSNAPSSSSPAKYVPQFSAATEMILKRINSGAGTANLSSGIVGTPNGYEDMRRSVMMSMRTTQNMELPATPVKPEGRSRPSTSKRASVGSVASASANTPQPAAMAGTGTPPVTARKQKNGTPSIASAGKGSAGRGRKPKAKVGAKRKRKNESSDEESSSEESDVMSKLGDDESESDGSENITSFPKITQSGRSIVKPAQFVPEVKEPSARKRGPSQKKLEQTLCKRCGRGHSPSNNQIVFCDGCNLGWHQMCHDPPVSDAAVQDQDAPWWCAECSVGKEIEPKPAPPVSAPANVSTNAPAYHPASASPSVPAHVPGSPFPLTPANYSNPPANAPANMSASSSRQPSASARGPSPAVRGPSEPPSLISWQNRSLEDVSYPLPIPFLALYYKGSELNHITDRIFRTNRNALTSPISRLASLLL